MTPGPDRKNAQAAAIAAGRRTLEVEAAALTRMAADLGDPFAEAVDRIAALTGRLVCTGMGKSGHVARKIAATLASTGQPAMFVHPGEASHGDLGMIGAEDAVLALSKTGETRELADILAYAKRFAIPLIAITAVADSALGRAADIVLVLPDATTVSGKIWIIMKIDASGNSVSLATVAGQTVSGPTTSTAAQWGKLWPQSTGQNFIVVNS